MYNFIKEQPILLDEIFTYIFNPIHLCNFSCECLIAYELYSIQISNKDRRNISLNPSYFFEL